MKYGIINIILAFVVTLSSTGFVLGKHHCKKQIQSRLTGIETSCAETGCQKGCCSTEFQYFQLDLDKQIQTLELVKKPEILAVILTVFQINFPSENTSLSNFQIYKPPIVETDISVMFQVFRL